MTEISTEIINIVYQLLPGFLAAWVFYGLTGYLKPITFERIVQALIFTVIIKANIIISKKILFFVGKYFQFGVWTEDVEFVLSLIYAIIFGLIITWCINNDFPLHLLRVEPNTKLKGILKVIQKTLSKINLTQKTLYPSEWYSTFYLNNRFIVLNFKDGRRLYGWPLQYPDDPNKGHFLISEPEWLLDDGTSAPLYTVKEILISTNIIASVDFLKNRDEITVNNSEIINVRKKLVKLQKRR